MIATMLQAHVIVPPELSEYVAKNHVRLDFGVKTVRMNVVASLEPAIRSQVNAVALLEKKESVAKWIARISLMDRTARITAFACMPTHAIQLLAHAIVVTDGWVKCVTLPVRLTNGVRGACLTVLAITTGTVT